MCYVTINFCFTNSVIGFSDEILIENIKTETEFNIKPAATIQ